MELNSTSIEDGRRIHPRYAFGRPAEPMELSDNLNPQLAWEGAPAGTRSFALLCVDPDVPTEPSLVNRDDAIELLGAIFVFHCQDFDSRIVELGSHIGRRPEAHEIDLPFDDQSDPVVVGTHDLHVDLHLFAK